MLKKSFLSTYIFLISGCVTVHNTELCSVAGRLSAGGICAEALTEKTRDMTFEEFVAFIEPASEPSPRAGAICQTSEDYNKTATSLAQACRELGSRCSVETRELIKGMINAPLLLH